MQKKIPLCHTTWDPETLSAFNLHLANTFNFSPSNRVYYLLSLLQPVERLKAHVQGVLNKHINMHMHNITDIVYTKKLE